MKELLILKNLDFTTCNGVFRQKMKDKTLITKEQAIRINELLKKMTPEELAETLIYSEKSFYEKPELLKAIRELIAEKLMNNSFN